MPVVKRVRDLDTDEAVTLSNYFMIDSDQYLEHEMMKKTSFQQLLELFIDELANNSGFVDVQYTDLLELINDSKLVAGNIYRFQTKVDSIMFYAIALSDVVLCNYLLCLEYPNKIYKINYSTGEYIEIDLQLTPTFISNMIYNASDSITLSNKCFVPVIDNDHADVLNKVNLGTLLTFLRLTLDTVYVNNNQLADKSNKLIQVSGLILLAANWSLVSGLYQIDFANVNITALKVVDVIPSNSTISIVQTAQILPYTLSTAGSVRIFATNLPTANINVILNIYE